MPDQPHDWRRRRRQSVTLTEVGGPQFELTLRALRHTIIYFVSRMVVHMWLSDRTLSVRRSGWPGIRCAFPLLSVLVLMAGCGAGGGAGCGVALPWVHVINQDGPTITVHLYAGASPVIVPAGTERVIHPLFAASSLPPPPW